MQLSIREKRKLFFFNKIVTPEVIRNLATIFHYEAASAPAIGKKTITRIAMRFQIFENDKNIAIIN